MYISTLQILKKNYIINAFLCNVIDIYQHIYVNNSVKFQ